MTLRTHAAPAASSVADATLAAPHGKARRAAAFSPIMLTDAAATHAPDQRVADLLPRLSKSLANGSDTTGIVKSLTAKFGADQASSVRIIVDGDHKLGSGFYVVGGNAAVDADGEGVLVAVGEANVTVRGTFDLYAGDRVKLNAFGRTQIYAAGDARVESSFDYVRGFAHGNVVGKARGSSVWSLFGSAHFDAWDNVSIEADNHSVVRLYDRARIEASGDVAVEMRDNALGWFKGRSTAQVWGSSIAYSNNPENVVLRGGSARLFSMPESGSLFTRRAWRAR